MMNQDDKYFAVKYRGEANPLVITLPPNERTSGQKYVEVELGSFFWVQGTSTNAPVPSVRVKIPGLSSGNYDINGKNTEIMVQVLPNDVYKEGTGAYVWQYTYSPGRPDLYLCPPSPTIAIGFYDDNGNLISFSGNAYYVSLNICI